MPAPDLSLLTFCRNDPVSARWVGIDAYLSEYQVDLNIYTLANVSQWLLDNYQSTVSMASVTQPSPGTILFTLTDASTFGPFTLPTAVFRDRVSWAVATSYEINDTFQAPDGGVYYVQYPHTSDPTSFDPHANDGMGHDYYGRLLTAPGNALPSGGATAMVLQKSTGVDYAVTWGYKLPTGGLTNQVLIKLSNTNQDADWKTLTANIVEFHPSTGSELSEGSVGDALEELESRLGSATLQGLSDVNFSNDDLAAGAMLYWDGDSGEWQLTPTLSDNQYLVFSSGVFVATDVPDAGAATLDDLTDVAISPAADVGDTLVFDGVSSKWVNRQSYFSIGSTSSNVDLASTNNYSTIKFVPGAALQLTNGGNGHRGEITTVIIATSGTTSYNITAGTNVKMNGALATGTVDGKYWTLTFRSDGVTLFEIGRTGPM